MKRPEIWPSYTHIHPNTGQKTRVNAFSPLACQTEKGKMKIWPITGHHQVDRNNLPFFISYLFYFWCTCQCTCDQQKTTTTQKTWSQRLFTRTFPQRHKKKKIVLFFDVVDENMTNTHTQSTFFVLSFLFIRFILKYETMVIFSAPFAVIIYWSSSLISDTASCCCCCCGIIPYLRRYKYTQRKKGMFGDNNTVSLLAWLLRWFMKKG